MTQWIVASALLWTISGNPDPAQIQRGPERLKIEAVDHRTGKPLHAVVRFDCQDVGETPFDQIAPPVATKISVSFEDFPWRRVKLDSVAKTQFVIERFRARDLDSLYLSANGDPRAKACIDLEIANAEKVRHTEGIERINSIGKLKKLACLQAPSRRCDRQLDSLRRRVREENEKLGPIKDRILALRVRCGDVPVDSREIYWEILHRSSPRGSDPDPKRYEDAMFNIAEIAYQKDQRSLLDHRKALQRWSNRDSCGAQPIPPLDPYWKGLVAHRRYLDSVPDGSRRDVILFRTSFIHGLRSESDSVIAPLQELVARYPNSRMFSEAARRIGKVHFAARRFDSAATWITRSLDEWKGDGFFPRAECMTDLVSSFLSRPDPIASAREFFIETGSRVYQDSIFADIASEMGHRLR